MGQFLDLQYEVNGGLQMLKVHLLCHPNLMGINTCLVLSKERLDFLFNITSKKSRLSSLVLKNDKYIVTLRLTSKDKEALRHIFLNTNMGECTSHATKQFLNGVGYQPHVHIHQSTI